MKLCELQLMLMYLQFQLFITKEINYIILKI